MNQIKILFLIAFFIQTVMNGLEIVKEDENSLYDSKALICIDICFECFSDDQTIDVNGVLIFFFQIIIKFYINFLYLKE